LIKVGDNGPLSATAKVLSDGLGNDSPMSMSTTLVGIGTASPVRKLTVSGDDDGTLQLRLLGNASTTSYAELGRESMSTGNFTIRLARNGTVITPLVINDQNGNVGIGTTSPAFKLDVASNESGFYAGGGIAIRDANATTNYVAIGQYSHLIGGGGTTNGALVNNGTGFLSLHTNGIEGMRITSDNYVRLPSTSGGIQFNGDTAAANALDDYEEGTWTMGYSFGGGTTGISYGSRTGSYTKIGRQVTVTGYMSISSKGSSVGLVAITGLPFTINNSLSNYSASSIYMTGVTYSGQYTAIGVPNTTTLDVYSVTELGLASLLSNVNFSNTVDLVISLTYFA
jgi:hypothetical protein